MDAQESSNQPEGISEGSRPEPRATTVRLPRDLIKAAKLYALEHETTLTKLIIEGLRERIKGEAKEKD
jgi:hypothetical protein